MEREEEAGSLRQAGVLGAPPGADGGGEQRGPLLQALLLLPEAEEAGGSATQQVIVLAIAQVEPPGVEAPVEAEVIEPSGLWEEVGGVRGCREGGTDREGLLRVPHRDVQLGNLVVMEVALFRLVPLATEAEVLSGAATMGT